MTDLDLVLRHARDEGYAISDRDGEDIIAALTPIWGSPLPFQVGSPCWWDAMELASELNWRNRACSK